MSSGKKDNLWMKVTQEKMQALRQAVDNGPMQNAGVPSQVPTISCHMELVRGSCGFAGGLVQEPPGMSLAAADVPLGIPQSGKKAWQRRM